MTQPTIAFEKITPTLAKQLLASNTHNRTLRPTVVDRYRRDMEAGRWQPTGEPIQLADDGTIINGQHRLQAVIEAKRHVRLPVIRNLPLSAQAVADQGLKRGFADVLRIQFHEVNVVALAAAIRELHLYRRSGMFGQSGGTATGANASVSELIQTYLDEPHLKHSIPPMQAVRKGGIRVSSGAAVAIHYVLSGVIGQEADDFYHRLAVGDELTTTDPIYLLRKLFLGPNRPTWTKAQAALIIKASNAWREGRAIQSLSWRGGGAHPEPFPAIEGAKTLATSELEMAPVA